MTFSNPLIGYISLFVALNTCTVSAETYHVVPSSSTPCPEGGVACFTLSQYATKPVDYFNTSNTTLDLLPGNHTLDSDLRFENITDLEIASNDNSLTVVTCGSSAILEFNTINLLHLSGFTTVGCTLSVSTVEQQFLVENCIFIQSSALQLNMVSSSEIMNSSITQNTGSVVTHPTNGVIHVATVTVLNSDLTLVGCVLSDNTGRLEGAAVWAENSTLLIHNSELNNNEAKIGSAVYARQSSVTLDDSTFFRNTIDSVFAGGGGALFARDSMVLVINSTFRENLFNGEQGGSGGGAIFATNTVLLLADTSFFDNVARNKFPGGAVYAIRSAVTIDNCVYTGNYAEDSGSALSADNGFLTIRGSNFTSNIAVSDTSTAFDRSGDGSIAVLNNTLRVDQSVFANNIGGGIFADDCIKVSVCASTFDGNSAESGAGVRLVNCTFAIDTSNFTNNFVSSFGGSGVSSRRGTGTINKCSFSNNIATTSIIPYLGGAVVIWRGFVTIGNSSFFDNSGVAQGGGVAVREASVRIENCNFVNNTATSTGGGLVSGISQLTLHNCSFRSNSARLGGAIYMVQYALSFESNMTFEGNFAIFEGAALFLQSVNFTSRESLNVENNNGDLSVFYILASSAVLSGNTTLSNNLGSLLVRASNLTFSGECTLFNNSHSRSVSRDDLGGALTSYQSIIFFTGRATLSFNTAERGGAILTRESTIYLFGEVMIAQNLAYLSGGGIYAHQSDLNFNGNTEIVENSAIVGYGGGIHALSANTMLSGGSLTFTENDAKSGGGMYLELNAKLYIVKNKDECSVCSNGNPADWLKLEFTNNTADYGGALFVSDETNSGTCDAIPFGAPSSTGECFFQALGLHTRLQSSLLNLLNTFFVNNTARVAGKTIYGGLVDRCSVSFLAEVFQKYHMIPPEDLNGLSYLTDYNITNLHETLTTSELSSDPVRVCFCKDNEPNCDMKPPSLRVRKGETFKLSVVAMDQVQNTIPSAYIRGFLSTQRTLRAVQITNSEGSCTELEFNFFSPGDSDQLTLYADGPCGDASFSTASVAIDFLPCPIGFQESNGACVCDTNLLPTYISSCSIPYVRRADSSWFSYINESNRSRFIGHQICPFDYCLPATDEVNVDLNLPNGADALCAFNRSGKLCGACEDGLSLLLGTNHCKDCTNNGLSLVIVFVFAGIALVTFLLACNLTVAVGTINGLIFYANVIITNRALLFPFDYPNVFTVFVAWFNLDLGFETCFFTGMDEYAKTWLQLAFPAYIIFLVSMIIVISEKSRRFTKLFSRTNPVAALATLILLSYAKLLRAIIISLSRAELDYSDGSRVTVWLVDANVQYLEGKHIPLFIATLVILLIGLAYTFLLFFWQWIQRCSSKKMPLRWINNVKLNSFMEAYHAPFTRQHRYWTGLLLLARLLLYLVTALTYSANPNVNLLTIIVIAGLLLLLKEIRIYRQWPNNMLESSFLLNLVLFAAATLYLRTTGGDQTPVALISTGITFLTFLGILVYHTYAFILNHFQWFNKLVDKAKLKYTEYKEKLRRQTRSKDEKTQAEINLDETFPRKVIDFTAYRGPVELFDSIEVSQNTSSDYRPMKDVNNGVTHTVVGMTNEGFEDGSDL